MRIPLWLSMRHCFALVLVSGLLLPDPARAQERPEAVSPAVVGSRVRVKAPTAVQGRVEGSLVEIDETSLTVSKDDRVPVKIPRQAVTEFEVSRGRHRRVLKGMLIGAGIGLAVGMAAPGTACFGCSSTPTTSDRLAFGGQGALVGAASGAGIGALVKGVVWHRVPLDRVRVSVAPLPRHGLELFVSARF